MKKALSILIFIVKRYYFALKIRYWDRISDNSFSANILSEKGFEIFDINELFDDPKALRTSLAEIEKKSGTIGLDMSWDLPPIFWNQILKSKILVNKIRNYLGETARLDDAYLKTIKNGLSSVSEGWHNDNVGYRLKLFIVFDAEGHAAPTLVIPAKRPNIYKFRLIQDTLRLLLGRSDVTNKKEQITINYQPGTCLLFDTNLEHRGGYSEGNGVRHCVIIEFICRKKASKVSGFAPCGPKQGKGQIIIQASGDLVRHSDLIDPEILQIQENNIHLYGTE